MEKYAGKRNVFKEQEDIYVKKNYVINNNAQYGWRKNVIKKYDI